MKRRQKVVVAVIVIAAELLFFLGQLVSFHSLGDLPNLTPSVLGAMLSTPAMTGMVFLAVSGGRKRRRTFEKANTPSQGSDDA